MKKPWLIIIIGFLAVTLIGIWLYLFFGGDEAKENLYNAFGLSGENVDIGFGDFFGDQEATSTTPYLRQLSLKPIIGYAPTTTAGVRKVFAAEAGTGHVFSINVADGGEERLSNITVPRADIAVFSKNANFAAIGVEDSSTLIFVTLPHGTTSLDSFNLETDFSSISFSEDNTLLYTKKEGSLTRAYEYDAATKKSNILFTVPFREVAIVWGSSAAGPHYVYPKPTRDLEGYLYEVTPSSFTRLPLSGFGFAAVAGSKNIFFSQTKNATYQSSLYNLEQKDTSSLYITSIPEKCTFTENSSLLCAINEQGTTGKDLPDTWYRGEMYNNDVLWYMENDTILPILVDNLGQKANRVIDAIKLQAEPAALFFINKVDSALWVYDRDFTTPVTDN